MHTFRKKIAPGMYLVPSSHGEVLHLEVPELLAELGLDNTEENNRLAVEGALLAWRRVGQGGTFHVLDDCPRCRGKGTVPGAPGYRKACSRCKGTGEVRVG